MTGRAFIAVIAFSALSVSFIWWSQIGSADRSEQLLFSKLDAAIAGNEPKGRDIIAAFDLPEGCRGQSCFLDRGHVGSLRYESGSLTQRENELIFVLEDFSGTCIRTEQVQTRYSVLEPIEGCAHGGCWARTTQYPWGILAFGVKQPQSKCVSSVVINSEIVWRPRD
jgi:hypothetical protein